MTNKKASTTNTPGERHRDEQRKDGGPRQEGRQWHDHETPKDIEPEAMAGDGAAPDVESGGEHEGMGRVKANTAEERELRTEREDRDR